MCVCLVLFCIFFFESGTRVHVGLDGEKKEWEGGWVQPQRLLADEVFRVLSTLAGRSLLYLLHVCPSAFSLSRSPSRLLRWIPFDITRFNWNHVQKKMWIRQNSEKTERQFDNFWIFWKRRRRKKWRWFCCVKDDHQRWRWYVEQVCSGILLKRKNKKKTEWRGGRGTERGCSWPSSQGWLKPKMKKEEEEKTCSCYG